MMDLSFLKDLDIKITSHARLKDFTTFRLGGPCTAMLECRDAATLTRIVEALRSRTIDFLVMGFGSNILASDQGVNLVMIRYINAQPVIRREGNNLTTDASTLLDDLILFSIRERLEGLLPLSGIPGTLGGAIAGNAGAHGIDISQTLSCLSLLKPDGRIITMTKEELQFGYRDSAIKHNGDIILAATFALDPGKDPEISQKTHDNIIATRQEKHGDWRTTPSAGSFFRNVLPSSRATRRESAGWFLEQAGAKTLHIGKSHAYEKHANIITCDEGGTAQDTYDLTLAMAKAVKEKFQIDLVREVRILGPFTGAAGVPEKEYW